MRKPSIKILMSGLGITREQAAELRDAMGRRRGLARAATMLNAHGIETIALPDGCFDNCHDPEVEIRYVNRGGTYETTLLQVNGQYRVGSWGDVVDAFGRR